MWVVAALSHVTDMTSTKARPLWINAVQLLLSVKIHWLFFPPDLQSSSDHDTSEDSSSDSDEGSDDDSSDDDENDEPLSLEWPETRKKQAIYLFLFPIVFPLWSTLPDVRNPVSIYLPSATGFTNWAIDFLLGRVPSSSFPCLESSHTWSAVNAAGSGTGALAAAQHNHKTSNYWSSNQADKSKYN